MTLCPEHCLWCMECTLPIYNAFPWKPSRNEVQIVHLQLLGTQPIILTGLAIPNPSG